MELRALVLPYPNFVLGSIIDPEEANENNLEITNRVNDLYQNFLTFSTNQITLSTPIAGISGADLQAFLVAFKQFVDTGITNLQTQITSNNGSITALQQKDVDLQSQITANLTSLQTSISTNVITLQNQIASNKTDIEDKLNTHKASSDHDNRYYTKTELTPFLRNGDTLIKEEVFTITNADNGDGTFSYSKDGVPYVGQISVEGYQVFTLTEGVYEIGFNRVEVIINDTLRRSVKSGGLVEISSIDVALTAPEGAGAEVTIKYYERIGFVDDYTIKLSAIKPPLNNGNNMWFKIIG